MRAAPQCPVYLWSLAFFFFFFLLLPLFFFSLLYLIYMCVPS